VAIPDDREAARQVTPRSLLLGVLAGSLLLRLALVQLGGQLYWSDEYRYLDARAAVAALAAGEYREAVGHFTSGDHPFFRVAGLVPAALERAAGREDTRIPAAFFTLFSVLNLWLLGLVARRHGATAWEGALVTLIAALSNTLTYWSRHLSPYDFSITLGLVGWLLGSRGTKLGSFGCGVFAALSFLVYAGYWTLAAAVGLAQACAARQPAETARRALFAAGGFLAALGAVFGAAQLADPGTLSRFVAFSRTVNQGLYSEGWRLPFEYLWEAERGLLAAWLLATGWCVHRLLLGRATPVERVGLLGLAVVYAALAVTSTGLHKFVVYGRLARPMVLFFSLLAANRLESLRQSGSLAARAAFAASLLAVSLQGVANFRGPLAQTFPLEFVRHSSRRGNFGILRRYGRVVAVNATNTHPLPDPVPIPRRYLTLREAAHPREYRPYQYEGSSPRERALVRSVDMRMRLLLTLPDD
jgi:hypothetical protein